MHEYKQASSFSVQPVHEKEVGVLGGGRSYERHRRWAVGKDRSPEVVAGEPDGKEEVTATFVVKPVVQREEPNVGDHCYADRAPLCSASCGK